MSNSTIRNAVRFALTAGVAASFVNAPAFAADDDDSTKLDRVEVTGSRIKRTQLEGAMPVTSVTREDIDKTGLASIGDLLQELPSAGSALNTNFNNGGDGSTRVDLRNLGSNRVLVLVNGRRWVNITGGSGAVDLNTIPISIIERVEVLKDGASAVYGSDAIAGVINIITRKDFDGAQANLQIGEFDEGDGRGEFYDFSVGSSGSRSSAFFNASYFNQAPVWAGDRAISKEPLFGTGTSFGSSTTPNGRFNLDPNDAASGTPCTTMAIPTFWCGVGSFGATHVGAPTGNPAFASGPNDPTVASNASNPAHYAAMTDFYNFAPENYLGTPSERWSIFAQGRYDINDNVTFTTEALFNKRVSEQLLAAMPVVLNGSGAARADGQFIPISVTNPYNPLNATIIDTSQVTLPYVAGGTVGARNLARRFVETGGRSFNQDVATYRFGAGFEGNFEAVGRVWDWTVGYTFTQTTEMDITYGLLNTVRLRNSLGPIASCIAPCVPLNFFGGQGSITQEMLDYVTFNAHDDLGTTQRNYTGNISGELFDLPAGPVGIAAGYEYRQEEGFDDPDALIAAGNTTGNARSPTSGSYSLSEIYAEFAIPILKDAPLAEDLELQFAIRSSDYDTFGNTTNMKFGIRWQPFNDLLVRGTFQEGFRAPNIAELYLGQSDSFPNLQDACSVPIANVAAGGTGLGGLLDPTPDNDQAGNPYTVNPAPGSPTVAEQQAAASQLYANCTGTTFIGAAGTFNPLVAPVGGQTLYVPVGTPGTWYGQNNPQIRITVGGNPFLVPETATSSTLGFVYSPSYIDGLSLTLDWYSIEIDDAIVGVGSTTIMNGCYIGSNSTFCGLMNRLSSGDLEDLLSSTANVASFTVEGIDLNVVYRAGELPLLPGEWKFVWDTAYVSQYEQCVAGALVTTCADFLGLNVGDGAIPKFKSQFDIDWTYGDWEVTWRMRFIGAQNEACSTQGIPLTTFGFPCSAPSATPTPTNQLGATTYHNVQVVYTLSEWDTRLTFGIQNIGDKQPPLSATAFANSFDATVYETPGRFPYLRVSKTF
jgi:iron complex outermembrane receptor protein